MQAYNFDFSETLSKTEEPDDLDAIIPERFRTQISTIWFLSLVAGFSCNQGRAVMLVLF